MFTVIMITTIAMVFIISINVEFVSIAAQPIGKEDAPMNSVLGLKKMPLTSHSANHFVTSDHTGPAAAAVEEGRILRL
jgi:hypothetical protein